MTERKATDVLIDVETKVNELLAYVKNIDLKMAILLDKLNSFTAETPKKQVHVETPDVEFPPYQPSAPSPFTSTPDMKRKLQMALEQAQESELADEITAEVKQSGKRRNLRFHGESQSRQIPVQQRIVYSDGKNVYMANVEIFDSNNKLVNKTTTDQVGKWKIPLPPGKYTISVSKAGTPLKPKVELRYEETVPEQDSTVELETRKMS